MNHFAIESDHKRVVARCRECQVVEGDGANHAKVLMAPAFAGGDIDDVMNVSRKQAGAVGILEANIKPHLLTL